ncbi:hypothetical protein Q4497_00575 [Mesomycoplasma ovipneumoniae]|uniref:DUF3352 domain-containing protein n=1 Tax=Mesomycoplasma ovipneumoniae TaxID=29562 RepID=A0AAW6Q7M7_9BACT|nr:hypothetical protein [Mesomycoplasma ovipneumoniae]MDF9627374.1 hypothetical protein [Mesomycoplasma ovipneumoniae]MDO4157515.1 hypothetical protein [Mesomycoplasma ovipneumoniae]MDO4158602.1 hypothetical protein [Mesomycoplasma ovipneumoniae]MDO6821522.1 hypothetical protein [Mesomycoplasma ovipneumoniae]MDO6855980.1 hypothetical protein [Mesomycoplasma ovipneumoniae]
MKQKAKKIFYSSLLLANFVAAGVVSTILIINYISPKKSETLSFQDVSDDENKFFISNTKPEGFSNPADNHWFTSQYWSDWLQKNPERANQLRQKYPSFENNLFKNSDNNSPLIKLSSFFRSEFKKNNDTLEFDDITDQGVWKDKKIINNFVILKNYNDFFSFFSRIKNDNFYKRVLQTPDFFQKKSIIAYVRPIWNYQDLAFTSKAKKPFFNPNHTFFNPNNPDNVGIMSFDSKFEKFFTLGLKYNEIIDPLIVNNPVVSIIDSDFYNEKFNIYYKIIEKSIENNFNPKFDIHISKIEDLVLYNNIVRDNDSSKFKEFLLKKQEILDKNNLKSTRLYARTNKNQLENLKFFSTLEETKNLIVSMQDSINSEWGGAFVPSKLFIPTEDNSEVFNKFILKKQDAKKIFDDEILYWNVDEQAKKIKIYTFNYKDLFPNFATEPQNFKIENLEKLEKIDIGNTTITQVEFSKIETLEQFNDLYNQIITKK